MRDKIRKILQEYKEVKEMGVSLSKLEKSIPSNYLLKNIKGYDKSKSYYELQDELINLRLEILEMLKNMQWSELKVKKRGGSKNYFVFPKNIVDKIKEFNKIFRKIERKIYLKPDLVAFQDDGYHIINENINIETEFNNRTHFPIGIPESFKGMSLGYKLYRKLVDSIDYIQSDIFSSPGVRSIYLKLIQDKDLNCVVTDKDVLVLKKSMTKFNKEYFVYDFITKITEDNDKKYILNKNLILDTQLLKELGEKNVIFSTQSAYDNR